MKKIASIIAATLMTVFFTTTVIAQNNGDTTSTQSQSQNRWTPEERAKMQTRQMVKKLSLTADQETKVDSINLAFANRKHDLMNGSSAKEEKTRLMKQHQDDMDAAFKVVLTENQYASYLQMREKKRVHKTKDGNDQVDKQDE